MFNLKGVKMPKATCCRICINLLKDTTMCYEHGKCPKATSKLGDLVITYSKPCNHCDKEVCHFFRKINYKVKY